MDLSLLSISISISIRLTTTIARNVDDQLF